MASSFHTASQKLAHGMPPFPLPDLPTTRDEPLWTEIRSDYSLTLAELSALKNHACEEQLQRRPPLHPDITPGAKEWNTNFDRKLDQILEATKHSDRATPRYSAALSETKRRRGWLPTVVSLLSTRKLARQVCLPLIKRKHCLL